MSLMKRAKAEMKKVESIKSSIESLKKMIADEELFFSLSEEKSEELEKSAENLIELCREHMIALESHLDDLQNEGLD